MKFTKYSIAYDFVRNVGRKIFQSIVVVQRIVLCDYGAHVALYVVIVVVLRILVSCLRKAWIQFQKDRMVKNTSTTFSLLPPSS